MTTRLVVDASVAFKWIQSEADSDLAERLIHRFELHAPQLLRIECANAFWSAARRGSTAAPDAWGALHDLNELVEIHENEPLLLPAPQLALVLEHPIYDCHYLALAIQLDCDLVTADRRFVRAAAASPHAARLKSLADVIA